MSLIEEGILHSLLSRLSRLEQLMCCFSAGFLSWVSLLRLHSCPSGYLILLLTKKIIIVGQESQQIGHHSQQVRHHLIDLKPGDSTRRTSCVCLHNCHHYSFLCHS